MAKGVMLSAGSHVLDERSSAFFLPLSAMWVLMGLLQFHSLCGAAEGPYLENEFCKGRQQLECAGDGNTLPLALCLSTKL